MAPNSTKTNNNTSSKTMKTIDVTTDRVNDNALQLASLRKALPEDVFVKSLVTSLYYLAFDALMWTGSLYLALLFTSSDYWKTLGFWPQAAFSFLYWNFAGFFMWCLFVSFLIYGPSHLLFFGRSLATIADMELSQNTNGSMILLEISPMAPSSSLIGLGK
jgi:hypothetical protein